MRWASELEGSAGPLLAAARRFVAEHPGAPSATTGGATALAELADAIDDWAERDETSPDDDERFVEGAGALLALVLLAHVGRGQHVSRGAEHRLQLGDDGFVDPFGVIDRALESEDARATLVAEVRRAESEAAAERGVGRAMRLLRVELARTRPDVSVVEAFGPSVRLSQEIELDLSSLLRATEDEPEATADKAVRKLVSMLPGGAGTTPPRFDEIATRLLPRPVAPGFGAKLAAEGRGELACRPWLGGALEIALVLGFEDRSRYVRADELDTWALDFDDALAHAVAELARRSTEARLARVDTSAGPLVVARTGEEESPTSRAVITAARCSSAAWRWLSLVSVASFRSASMALAWSCARIAARTIALSAPMCCASRSSTRS